uniref:TIGR01212 family radical SAM protein n=1 Tax=Prevotella sp. GTC17260 TaxID=3236796 RepID=A0AB33JIR4_9BACT
MAQELHYNDFGTWMKARLPFKVQKISINAGFTCPNRDGRIGHDGCTFCDNSTFSPSYCNISKSIQKQLQEGKQFFSRKYPEMKYLAYFQAYTNTYESLDILKSKYEQAFSDEDIVGIVVGTRPDCINKELLEYFQQLSKEYFVLIEYGIESTNELTLKRINRGHTYQCSKEIIQQTHDYNILTGGHVILGLPGEDRDTMLEQADEISKLPLDLLKIHQLQVITGTEMAREYQKQPFEVFTVKAYIELLAEYIARLNPSITLDRFVSQSPEGKLIAPKWGLKNYQFTNLLNNYLQEKGIYQGQKYNPKSSINP